MSYNHMTDSISLPRNDQNTFLEQPLTMLMRIWGNRKTKLLADRSSGRRLANIASDDLSRNANACVDLQPSPKAFALTGDSLQFAAASVLCT